MTGRLDFHDRGAPMGTQADRPAVLLVEDDVAIARELIQGLQRHGMSVHHVTTGAEGLRAADAADVVLVDLGLPDIEGLELCRRVRARSPVPILVVSARSAEADRVEALQLGADDFLVKPFGLRELVARIHAVQRRSDGGRQLVLEVPGLRLDRRSRTAELHGAPVHLAPKEFDLLATLMEDVGNVVPRRTLLDTVWHGEWYGAGRTLDVHVAALRRKLGGHWITTVHGVGFRFQPHT